MTKTLAGMTDADLVTISIATLIKDKDPAEMLGVLSAVLIRAINSLDPKLRIPALETVVNGILKEVK